MYEKDNLYSTCTNNHLKPQLNFHRHRYSKEYYELIVIGSCPAVYPKAKQEQKKDSDFLETDPIMLGLSLANSFKWNISIQMLRSINKQMLEAISTHLTAVKS